MRYDRAPLDGVPHCAPSEAEGVDREVNPYPFIWADEIKRPQLPGKTRLSPKRRNRWRGWVTHARIDENLVIRGTQSLL